MNKFSQGIIIGIVGTIGCGKTTLGKLLAKKNSWKFLEEDWKSNPYVVGDKAKKSSQLEISLGFLIMRKKQNESAKKLKSEGKVVLLDTIFEMTDLYSKSTLDKVDYEIFKTIYGYMAENIANPDILIYLNGDHGIFIKRALKRNLGVKLEKELINEAILKSSDTSIRRYLKNVDKRGILSLDTSKIDIRDGKNIEIITKEIIKMNNSKN